MINLFMIEVIGDFINVLIMMYFFNRVMPPKNKRYSQVCTIIMIIIGLMSIFWTQKVKLFYAALLANNSH